MPPNRERPGLPPGGGALDMVAESLDLVYRNFLMRFDKKGRRGLISSAELEK
jgi:hypothetical protein